MGDIFTGQCDTFMTVNITSAGTITAASRARSAWVRHRVSFPEDRGKCPAFNLLKTTDYGLFSCSELQEENGCIFVCGPFCLLPIKYPTLGN
jgi:hypothetical protein